MAAEGRVAHGVPPRIVTARAVARTAGGLGRGLHSVYLRMELRLELVAGPRSYKRSSLMPGLPDSLDVNLPPWTDVNMTWDAQVWRDDGYNVQQATLLDTVAAAEAAWAAAHPDLAACIKRLDAMDEVDDVLDQLGLWACPSGVDVDAWLQTAQTAVDGNVPEQWRSMAHDIIRHRHAVAARGDVVGAACAAILADRDAWQRAHAAKQFVNHPANKPGVLIALAAKDDRPMRVWLIGDTVPSGASSGCCTDGVKDDDVVLCYRDLSEIIDLGRQR